MDWAAARMRYKMGAAADAHRAENLRKLSELRATQESSKGWAEQGISPSTIRGGADMQAHLQRLEAELRGSNMMQACSKTVY